MSNGHEIEKALLEGLMHRGFMVERDQILDERFRVDAVVVAPPGAWKGRFFPTPIAVQVTTNPVQWTKYSGFVRSAEAVADRLAYVELILPDYELTEIMINGVATALIMLFRDRRTPRVALIRVHGDQYKITDLQETLARYQSWIGETLQGEIAGHITYWNRTKRYGFALAKVEGPAGSQEIPFFIHMNAITDESLRSQLSRLDGELADEARIPVTFDDGGREGGKDRKSAVRARRRPPSDPGSDAT